MSILHEVWPTWCYFDTVSLGPGQEFPDTPDDGTPGEEVPLDQPDDEWPAPPSEDDDLDELEKQLSHDFEPTPEDQLDHDAWCCEQDDRQETMECDLWEDRRMAMAEMCDD